MRTTSNNLAFKHPISFREEVYGKVRRTYPKLNTQVGYYEALTFSK